MDEFFHLMIPAFSACLILTGIHAYLGLHVLEREVIFVDLALAQIAALGSTVGVLFSFDLHSTQSYFISLSFALVGALIFSISRFNSKAIPHEAIIGIVYAVSAAAVILVLSRAASGGEELKTILVGHLLFVSWNEIGKIFIIYALVGILHFKLRRQFFLISSDPSAAIREGINVPLFDFLFYASFAFVVTSSVAIAGVLLVFSFLIVPAVCSFLFAKVARSRLMIAWICGGLTSALGVLLSFLLDFPTGAMVVCCFGLSLGLCTVLSKCLRKLD